MSILNILYILSVSVCCNLDLWCTQIYLLQYNDYMGRLSILLLLSLDLLLYFYQVDLIIIFITIRYIILLLWWWSTLYRLLDYRSSTVYQVYYSVMQRYILIKPADVIVLYSRVNILYQATRPQQAYSIHGRIQLKLRKVSN